MAPKLLLISAVLAFAPAAFAAPAPIDTLKHAKTVLDELEEIPTKSIPKKLLADAEAVVIFPDTVKAGFVVGGRAGHGVALLKDKDGGWGDLRFLSLGGASVGFQAGIQVTDVVLVFKTRKGLDRILDGKAKLTLGADASVAAGPVGRDAEIATDGKLKAEIWSYSRSRGLFAGVALDGVILAADSDTQDKFVKDSREELRKAAEGLKMKVAGMTPEKGSLPPAVIPPAKPNDLPPVAVPPVGPVEPDLITPKRGTLFQRIFRRP